MRDSQTKSIREFSTISDDELLKIITLEYSQSPKDFKPTGASGDFKTDSFLSATSGRAINPIKKWL